MKWILPFLYLVFFAGFIGSFRAVSSLSTAALLAGGIIINWKNLKQYFLDKRLRFFLLAAFLYFLLVVFYAVLNNDPESWTDVQLKSGMILIPVAVICSLPGLNKRDLFYGYCTILFLASAYCFVHAAIEVIYYSNNSALFYHALVKPLNQHAVYFSVYVFIALAILINCIRKERSRAVRIILFIAIIFFTGFLFLLSSRIVIFFFILYVLWILVARKFKPALI